MEVDCAASGCAKGRPVARADNGYAAESVVNVPLGDGSCLDILAQN